MDVMVETEIGARPHGRVWVRISYRPYSSFCLLLLFSHTVDKYVSVCLALVLQLRKNHSVETVKERWDAVL